MQHTNGISPLHNVSGASSVNGPKTSVPARVSSEETSTSSKADQARLSAAVAAVTASSDVRLDRVASIRHAIASGSYEVSSGQVADKIITALLV